MKTVLLMSALLLLTSISQCGDRGSNTRNPVLGQYELIGRDNSGALTFSGTIVFASFEDDHLKGQCRITRQPNAPEGLFDQDGICAALLDGKKVELDSAPSLDDAGLLLEGEFDGTAIRGIWRLGGFVSSEPLGKFEAVKKM